MCFRKLFILILFAHFAGNGFLWGAELNEAEITTIKNMVARQEGSGEAVPAKTSDKIHENSKVTTEAASMAELTFADSSITRLGANSLFSFQSKERLIKLDQGSLLIHTPPGNGGVTVDCGGVTGAVTGTTFLASKDKAGNVLFVLLEGTGGLKVSMPGSTATIRPGQAASIGTEVIANSRNKGSEPATSAATPAISGAGVDRMAGAKVPDIRVFEIDIRRLVATTPLIADFKSPLPSEDKITATIETQQAKVKSGKIEDFGLEVVAVAHEDGDLLVGSHSTWDKEDLRIVNPQRKVADATEDSLGIETAAGEGAPPPEAKPINVGGGDLAAAPPMNSPPPIPNTRDLAPPDPINTLTVQGIKVSSKVYDGTLRADLDMTGAFLQGGVATGISLANNASGQFNSKNVGPTVPVKVSVTLTGPDAQKYVLLQPTGLVAAITKKNLDVFNGVAQDKIYDGTTAAVVTGAVLQDVAVGSGTALDGKYYTVDVVVLSGNGAGTFADKNVGTGKAVGTAMTIGGAGAGNYNLVQPVGLTANITERPITLAADAKTKVYGQSDAALTYAIGGMGLVSGENLTGALSRVAGQDVGKYAISQNTLAVDPAVAGNYTVTYVGADYEITQRAITLAAQAKTKVYGNADVALTYTIGGLGLAYSDTVTGTLNRAAGETVGKYAINQNTLNVETTKAGNYTVTFTGADYEITKRAITLAADAKTKVYGQSDVALTHTVGGLGLGFSDTVTGSLSRVTGENVGKYAINQNTLNVDSAVAGNYTVSYTGADYEITKAPLTVTANNKTVTYNGTAFLGGNGVTYSGFVLGENETSLGLIPTYGGTSQGAINKGTYALTPQGLPSGNYEYNYVSGTLTIEAIPFGIVTWKPDMKPDEIYQYVSTLALPGDIKDVTYSIVDQNGNSYSDLGGQRATIDSQGEVLVGRILGADKFYVQANIKNDAGNYLTDVDRKLVNIGKPEDYENPFRRLLNPPSPIPLDKLDEFFFYRGKTADNTTGPDKFYSDVNTKERTLGPSGKLFSDETKVTFPGVTDVNFYAMDKLTQKDPVTSVTLDAPKTVIYAREINLGVSDLDERTLSLNGLKLTIPDYSDLRDLETGVGNATGVGVTSKRDTTSLQAKYAANGNVPYYLRSASLKIVPYKTYNTLPVDPETGLPIDPDLGNMFAGDYAATLTYWNTRNNDAGGSQTVNLFNQIGATADEPWGSPANGIEVTLSDYTGWAVHGYAGDPVAGLFQPGKGDFWLEDSMGQITPGGEFALNVADLAHLGRGVWDDWSVYLTQRIKISIANGLGKDLAFVSGDGGTRIDGTLWDAGSANLSFQSTGNLTMLDSDFYRTGNSWDAESAQDLALTRVGVRGSSGTDVSLAAEKNVKMEDVELIGTSAGAPSVPNLAVVQSKDGSLEMRNVTIQGFSSAEMKSDSVKNQGRVLISGTAATKYNIKELVGAAVSADAKIQMAALDSSGALDGEMTVEKQLPVATKLASALARIDEVLPAGMENEKVQAAEIDLRAKQINFNQAALVAMDSITARANTLVFQNSFMTVVRNSGMINMYVQTGLVNRTYDTVSTGYLNFTGAPSTFKIGNVLNLTIANSDNIVNAINSGQMLENVSTPQAGKVNVIKL